MTTLLEKGLTEKLQEIPYFQDLKDSHAYIEIDIKNAVKKAVEAWLQEFSV